MSDDRRSGQEGRGEAATTVLVDGHVHLHPTFDEARFLQAAARNFAIAASELGITGPWTGVLVFTEIAGSDRFRDLHGRVGRASGAGWTAEATEEPTSLRVRPASGRGALTVVAGRQIQTAEGLEVLAFPLREPVADGRPIREVLRETADAGATGMVPWGLGKWWGSRGELVRRMAVEEPGLPFVLADTGHRPGWTPRPQVLEAAEQAGRAVVTGSDPFPFPSEEERAGSCCFELHVREAPAAPAKVIAKAVAGLEASPRRYESRVGTARFVASQLAMQVRKWVR